MEQKKTKKSESKTIQKIDSVNESKTVVNITELHSHEYLKKLKENNSDVVFIYKGKEI